MKDCGKGTRPMACLLAVVALALTAGSAAAGNGNGKGNGNGHGNGNGQATAPGQVKKDKDGAGAASAGSSVAAASGAAAKGAKGKSAHAGVMTSAGVEVKDASRGAIVDEYQVPATSLSGPGNSGIHKVTVCHNGHPVTADLHSAHLSKHNDPVIPAGLKTRDVKSGAVDLSAVGCGSASTPPTQESECGAIVTTTVKGKHEGQRGHAYGLLKPRTTVTLTGEDCGPGGGGESCPTTGTTTTTRTVTGVLHKNGTLKTNPKSAHFTKHGDSLVTQVVVLATTAAQAACENGGGSGGNGGSGENGGNGGTGGTGGTGGSGGTGGTGENGGTGGTGGSGGVGGSGTSGAGTAGTSAESGSGSGNSAEVALRTTGSGNSGSGVAGTLGGVLPRTGLSLGIFALVAAALVAAGLAMRRRAGAER